MNHLLPAALAAFAAVGLVAPSLADAAQASAHGPAAKVQTAAGRLLLPFFESNFQPVGGIETFFAVRNQDTAPVGVTIRYYEVDRPTAPQLTETLTLGPKQTSTHIIRLKDVIRGSDGIARGYAYIDADRPVITGDYFRVDDGENFAAGDRLVNADPTSVHYELCRFFTLRAFAGGSFNGGTTFTVFVASDLPLDGSVPVAFYTVYDEPGNALFAGPLFRDQVTFRVLAKDLGILGLTVPDFAVIELEFNQAVGHVWSQMDGNGRLSVGLNGSCDDAAPAPN